MHHIHRNNFNYAISQLITLPQIHIQDFQSFDSVIMIPLTKHLPSPICEDIVFSMLPSRSNKQRDGMIDVIYPSTFKISMIFHNCNQSVLYLTLEILNENRLVCPVDGFYVNVYHPTLVQGQ